MVNDTEKTRETTTTTPVLGVYSYTDCDAPQAKAAWTVS